MSRDIDFSEPLNEEDTEYVKQRSWLRRDAELAGHTVVLFGEEAPEPSDPPKSEDPEDVDYNDLKVDELKAEIAARNEEREDEETHIKVDSKANRADLIAALEEDDELNEPEEEDDDEA
jgi:hypothetical protein